MRREGVVGGDPDQLLGICYLHDLDVFIYVLVIIIPYGRQQTGR